MLDLRLNGDSDCFERKLTLYERFRADRTLTVDIEGTVEESWACRASGEPSSDGTRAPYAEGTSGCRTTKWQCTKGAAKLLSGMGRVSILSTANERKRNSAEAPRSFEEPTSISPKDSGLPRCVAGPWILPDSTTGLLNYFGCTVPSRPPQRLQFGNTWIVFTPRIASPWRI